MTTAADVMRKRSDLITLSPDDSAEDAIHTLLDNSISGAPVVDADGNLVGIISEFQLLEVLYNPDAKEDQVNDLMTKAVLSVEAEKPLLEVTNLFIVHRIRRVPVVSAGNLVGLISRRDLLRHAVSGNESKSEKRMPVDMLT